MTRWARSKRKFSLKSGWFDFISSPSSPENVPRLFDLVRPKDSRFRTAFYYGLRDTLVGTDLEQATRIGLQGRTRYRVVTLGGQVVDIAGES